MVSLTILLAATLTFSCASSGGSASSEPVEGFSWNFADPGVGSNGWAVAADEFWDHKGTANVSWDDTTFGRGMLRLDLDFTNDSGSEWSEPKMKYAFNPPFKMKGIASFTFDVIYNPALSSTGIFKCKVMAFNGSRAISEAEESQGIIFTDEMGNGYMKATVKLRPKRTSDSMDKMIFAIVGYRTDYKGPVFIENMRWE
jgi:hypothetical protein